MRQTLPAVTLASILAVALVVVAQLRAQAPAPLVPTPTPFVVSGSDIGFRIEGTRGTAPVDRLVVRINGQWVEPNQGAEVKRLTQ